jgi:large subunit ribosomal protein L9
LQTLAKKLATTPLRFTLKTGPHGEVFNSITKEDIILALKKAGSEPTKIDLEKPLRTIGNHTIAVHFHHGIKEDITISTAVDK